MAELVFIRHAESVWNARLLWQGQADPPLSERGHEQARTLSGRLMGLGLEALVTSDLRRARETAAALAEGLGIPIALEPALRELDVGRWSGLTNAEIEARWPDELARFRAGDLRMRPGGGESRDLFAERVAGALARLASDSRGRLGVVAHLGVLRSRAPGARLANADFLILDSQLTAAPRREYPGSRGSAL